MKLVGVVKPYRVGKGSIAVVIPKNARKILGIDVGKILEVYVEGEKLIMIVQEEREYGHSGYSGGGQKKLERSCRTC